MEARKVKPRRDWCSVLNDKREKIIKGGLLVLPDITTNAEKLTEGVGVIVRVGPGDKNMKLDLSPGTRVAYRSYLKFAAPIPTDEKWEDGSTKEYFLVDTDDIVGVIGRDTNVGIFSSPASHSIPDGTFTGVK